MEEGASESLPSARSCARLHRRGRSVANASAARAADRREQLALVVQVAQYSGGLISPEAQESRGFLATDVLVGVEVRSDQLPVVRK